MGGEESDGQDGRAGGADGGGGVVVFGGGGVCDRGGFRGGWGAVLFLGWGDGGGKGGEMMGNWWEGCLRVCIWGFGYMGGSFWRTVETIYKSWVGGLELILSGWYIEDF